MDHSLFSSGVQGLPGYSNRFPLGLGPLSFKREHKYLHFHPLILGMRIAMVNFSHKRDQTALEKMCVGDPVDDFAVEQSLSASLLMRSSASEAQ
ncbi:hypothetical protein AZ468_23585 (plasmid) [Vibrio europaeus]|uniref:Uncharacterized protein n=1 Tax=Vibrio europaeus TaxID=300876 RepID=A0A178J477_9VIBR|nr:hypothetical protein AZ468_23585 [Vibrio europaeus]